MAGSAPWAGRETGTPRPARWSNARQAPLALLCLGLLVFGIWAHLIGYPPGDEGPVASFLEALRTTP